MILRMRIKDMNRKPPGQRWVNSTQDHIPGVVTSLLLDKHVRLFPSPSDSWKKDRTT